MKLSFTINKIQKLLEKSLKIWQSCSQI